MPNPSVNDYLNRHEKVLEQILNDSIIPAPQIKEAMHYALFPGGKRIRPLLVYLSGELLRVPQEALDYIAAAIELTHCYSLIHDDLPAMDDDDMRRGKPSCHRAFDEATAILVGDAMQALAIEVLLHYLPQWVSSDAVIAVSLELLKASGASGMVSGQSLDLTELANPNISEERLKQIHGLKTGCLISACIKMPLKASQAGQDDQIHLEQFANLLGLVFQMQDDYLDQYAKNDPLGKGRASDLANEKTTFASLYSQSDLLARINQYYQDVRDSLSLYGDKAQSLHELIDSLAFRN